MKTFLFTMMMSLAAVLFPKTDIVVTRGEDTELYAMRDIIQDGRAAGAVDRMRLEMLRGQARLLSQAHARPRREEI